MMRNHYEFDWNIVAKLDPSYLQYLEDVWKIKLEEDENPGLNPGDPNIHDHSAADLNLLAPAAANPDGTINLDNDWRAKGLSEEEKAVVEMMHSNGGDAKEGGIIEGATMVLQPQDGLVNTTEDVEPKYRLKAEYRDYPQSDYTGQLRLLLAPPKRVLGPGSEFWIGHDLRYEVIASNERNPDIVWLRKHGCYYRHPKVGMFNVIHRLDRIHDASSELKKFFRMAVYNLETAKLYYITGQSEGKHKRITKKVTQASLNRNGVLAVLSITDKAICARFVGTIRDYILKAIPNAYVPAQVKEKQPEVLGTNQIRIGPDILSIIDDSRYRGDVFYALMLQHKVGQRLEWLSDEAFLLHISEIAGMSDLAGQLLGRINLTGNEDELIGLKREAMVKRKTRYTVFANLRKRPGAKTVTRSLFGPWHRNIFHKILTWNDSEMDPFRNVVPFLFDLAYTISSGVLPTATYHLFVELVKRGDIHSRRQLIQFSTILGELRPDPWTDDGAGTARLLPQLGLYTRTVRNILSRTDLNEVAVDGVINWHMFRDMLDMARELNIRVRINKFTCVSDIQRLHDRFAVFQQRDLEIHNTYSAYTFLPLESPDKEYGGFRFIQLATPDQLVEEGKTMHHCVGGYSKHCLMGKSILFSMFKGRSWITVELDGSDYTIRQKYTIKDFTVQNKEILEIIDEWLHDLVEIHKNDEEPYQVRANAHYQVQLNAEKLEKLEAMEHDNMSPDEKSWLEQALATLKGDLEGSLVKMTTKEVPNATSFEQIPAPA